MAVDLQVEYERYIRPSTVAEMMDVSVDKVVDMAHHGELEGVRFGSQIRIRLKSLQDYLATHRLEAETPQPVMTLCDNTTSSAPAPTSEGVRS